MSEQEDLKTDPSAPADPGCLPAWELDEIPAPTPFSLKNAIKTIGPGAMLVGAAIGSGEWLLGPALTARYGGVLLWIATISILMQVCINTEASRYTLYTGEPIFTGYMRCRPGARFWSFFYIMADGTTLWPGLVANAATATAAAWLTSRGIEAIGSDAVKVLSNPEHQLLIKAFAYGIFAVCVSLVLFGKKVYNTIKIAITGMVIWILGYLIIIDVFMVDGGTWLQVGIGFLSFGNFGDDPANLDWGLVAAFAAFAGAGGLGNAGTSNYIREQGWGMGGKVGAIPAAIGGREISLSHIGKVFPLTDENIRRFREWYKYVRFDQYGIWMVGCFFGIALPAMLALQFIGRNLELSGWEGAAFQAAGIAQQYGPVFWYLTLLCGFLVLFSSQLLVVDSVGRRWSDMIWTGTLASGRTQETRRGVITGFGIASLLYALLIGTGQLSGMGMLYAALIIYGVPLAVYGVHRLSDAIADTEVENRMLAPVAGVFIISIALAVILGVARVVEWGDVAMVLVVGVLWLVGSLFVIARYMKPHNVFKIYYLVVGIYVVWCCIALQISEPLEMIIISANIGGFLLVITALHTWWVNRRFLPRVINASIWKQSTLWMCAAWYTMTTALSLDKVLQDKLDFNLGMIDLIARLFGG